MTTPSSNSNGPDVTPGEGDAELDALVAEFLLAEQAGRRGALEDWLARAGPRAAAFQQFLACHSRLQALIGDSEAAASGTAATRAWRSGEPLELVSEAELAGRSPAGGSFEPGTVVGDYELLEEIARGGMGVVYRARQRGLQRIVALKMILAGEWARSEDVERFRAEARAAAQLSHSGIVPIYDFGEHEGRHFFTMALIEGPSLAERERLGPVPPREAAEIVRCVAEAVAHAHAKGVVHRDLKPANVLLAKREVPGGNQAGACDGLPYEPKVTDFGLAKLTAAEPGLTATGQALGTPSYMSPEQAAGRGAEVGPLTDVYSLGAMLYELLTGRPPFRAASPLETMRQVIENQPAPPRLLNAAVPVDLETICIKCLEKLPAHRYASAQAVADDLRCFLQGEPISARSVNLVSRVTHALGQRRHEEEFAGWGRAVALGGLSVLAAHLAMFVLQSWSAEEWLAYWVPRSLMFASLFVILWLNRPQSLLPTNSAERLVWALWGALLLGLGSVNLILAAAELPTHLSFALSAVMGGITFFVLGSHLWGGCYVLGIAFFVAAPWIARTPATATLWTGLLWCVAMCVLGYHYWKSEG